jgi:predicted 2-oxoglutarate/Fe(II)-dependent dioxygenase YbiX
VGIDFNNTADYMFLEESEVALNLDHLKFHKSKVRDNYGNVSGVSFTRRCRESFITDADIIHQVQLLFIRANVHFNEVFNINNIEVRCVMYDEADAGYFNWHHDIYELNPEKYNVLSLSYCVQDSYTGGELEFRDGSRYKLAEGQCVVFKSSLEHKVNVITSGRRTMLVAWVRL